LVKWRLHTHFEPLHGVPTRIDVTPNGVAEHDERAVLETLVESDRLYVADRGYAKFALFNKIVAANSSYVVRLRDNSAWETLDQRYRNDDAQLEEILSDEMVRFPAGKANGRPDHPVRVVCIRINPHTTRGKYRGGSSGVDSDGVCGSPRIFSMFRRRSSRSFFLSAGRSKSSSGFSSTSWAAVTCSATTPRGSKSKRTARSSPAC
jgi:hypothetical protein